MAEEKKAKYKIIHEREKCIGCGSCVALCPENWDMGEDGKSILKGGAQNAEGHFEVLTSELGCYQDAANACPVSCILVKEL